MEPVILSTSSAKSPMVNSCGLPRFTGPRLRGVNHRDNAADQIVDVTETPGLTAISVNGDRVTVQGLSNEVGNDSAITGAHARTVGIENPDDTDVQPRALP